MRKRSETQKKTVSIQKTLKEKTLILLTIFSLAYYYIIRSAVGHQNVCITFYILLLVVGHSVSNSLYLK